MRCTHYIAGGPHRCICDATHYLCDEQGAHCGIFCADHASMIVDEYNEELGWKWSMVLIEEEL